MQRFIMVHGFIKFSTIEGKKHTTHCSTPTPKHLLTPTFYTLIQCEFKKKKGNRDSILNLSKSKRKIMTLLSAYDNIFIFLSYGTLVIHIGSENCPPKIKFWGCPQKFYHIGLCAKLSLVVNHCRTLICLLNGFLGGLRLSYDVWTLE